MSEWRECRLEDLAASDDHALATGPFGSAISSRHFVDSGVPVIRGSNLSLDVGHRLIEDDFVFLPEQKATSFKRSVARRGDLVFTCWGTVGQVGFISSRSRYPAYVVSNKQMKMTPDPTTVDALFLYYLLSSPGMVGNVQGQAIGTSVPGFNLGQLRELRVRLPQLSAQRQITEVLGSIDDLIETNRLRIALLERMAQAIYREWFVHFRYPGHEHDELVDSPLGPFPADWEVMKLGAVAETQYGFTDSATRSPVGPKFLRVMDINKRSYISWPDVPHCSPDVPERFRLHEGDVVIARMADPGKVGIVEREIGAVFASYLVRVRPTASWLRSYYLFFVVSASAYQEFVLGASTGTTRKSISAKVMEEGLIVKPAADVLDAFIEAAAPMRSELTALAHASERLAVIRDLLLPKLVTGVIDVSHLDLDALLEEPAA